jgi:hypothetical protein
MQGQTNINNVTKGLTMKNVIIIVLLSLLTGLVAAKEYREYNERFEKRVKEIGTLVRNGWQSAALRRMGMKAGERQELRGPVCKELFPDVKEKYSHYKTTPNEYYTCVIDSETYGSPKLEQIEKDDNADQDKWYADNPCKTNDDIRQEIKDGKWDNWK